MKSFKSIYLTQAKLFWRDRTALIITLFLPIILAVFFGLIFSNNQSAIIRLAMVDSDRGTVTRSILNELLKKDYLEINEKTYNEALGALRNGDADIVIVLPKGTTESALSSNQQSVVVYYDPNKFRSAGIGVQVARSIFAEINLAISKTEPVFSVRAVSSLPRQKTIAEFYLPNFLALSVLWLGLFATAIPIAQNRENKVLLRMGATPLSSWELMFGFTLWRLTLGIIQTILFLATGITILGLPTPDNIFLLLAAVIAGNLTFISMGYMISAISTSTESAGSITQLFNFPMMFLSGIFFTQDMLPDIINKVSLVIPLTYLADLYRQIIVDYPGTMPIPVSFAVLAGFSVLFSLIALRLWRWE
jgi:ABC-2 type transport system permease protein